MIRYGGANLIFNMKRQNDNCQVEGESGLLLFRVNQVKIMHKCFFIDCFRDFFDG
jgi:hypothetical protein